MHERSMYLRGTAAGIASMAVGAVVIVAGLSSPAGADHVDPTLVEDNPACVDVAPDGVTWNELKVEPAAAGDFTDDDGALEVTITITETNDEDESVVFDWTSNIGVDAVIVKGGPDANVYFYDPEATGDTGLHAPVNNGEFFGLSHVSFCYDEDDTTTTTEEGTTTTTEEGTTTTVTITPSAGPPAPGETTTTVGGAITPSAGPSGELPRTGSSSGPMVGIGAGLLVGGGILVGLARRFRRA